jgi:hypothetical protein
MKVIAGLLLIGLASGCAGKTAPVETVATNSVNPACQGDSRAREKKHRELALRKQRMKQYHARGLSPPENEAALERALEAERTACVAVQTGDEPIQQTTNVPVQPIPAADEPVAQPAGEPAVQPVDEQLPSD